MKALYKSHAGPGLELVDRPDPACGPHDVVIRVLMTGICGTDLHIVDFDDSAAEMLTLPLIPGHEFYGEVVETGSMTAQVRAGDRVSGEGHVVCGSCRNCRAGRRQMCIRTESLGVQRDGAFAEYVVLPEANVWVHDHEEITPVLGALFDPFGNAVHTALAFPVIGEDVLITGAGPIGLMAAAVARHAGARHVVLTDVLQERLAMAPHVGADHAVDVSTGSAQAAQETLGMDEGFDVGMEMSGHPAALRELVDNMNHGGSVALLGLPSTRADFSWARVVTRMLTLKGIYGREMFDTWHAMSAMLQSDARLRTQISSVVTHEFPAWNWREAFATAASRTAGKVMLDWSQLQAPQDPAGDP